MSAKRGVLQYDEVLKDIFDAIKGIKWERESPITDNTMIRTYNDKLIALYDELREMGGHKND